MKQIKNIKVNIFPDHETRTSVHINIGEINFDLTDKEAKSLIQQLFIYRDDLFQNLDNSKQILEDKIELLEIENRELEDEISDLKDRIEELESEDEYY